MHKKYITKQDDLKDCGPACIHSLLKYYKGYVPLETIRKDTCLNKNGTTAYHLIEALKKYGFRATGLRYEENIDIFKEIALPVIVHLKLPENFEHFVVLYKVDSKKQTVLVMDPAVGYKTLSIKEFRKLWTKIVIEAIPQEKIVRKEKPQSILKLFIKLFLKEKRLVFKLISITLLLIIINIFTSFYIEFILSVYNENTSLLFRIIIIFLIFTFLKILLGFFRNSLENTLNINLDEKIIIPFINHTFYLPLSYIKSKTSGEIMTRIKELHNIKDLFSKIFVTIFLDFLIVIITLIVILKVNNILFWALWIVLLLDLLIAVLSNTRLIKQLTKLIESETTFNSILTEDLEGIETIKHDNGVVNILDQINNCFKRKQNDSFSLNKLLNKIESLKSSIEELGLFTALTIGIILVINKEISILQLITFNSLIYYLLDPFKNIIGLLPELCYVKAFFNKISEYIGVEEEKINEGLKEVVMGDISFKNISFSYDQYHYLFNNLTFSINKNEHIMLKGPSGCGKSTICKLLYRLYDLEEGKILINGKRIDNYAINNFRNNIMYLSQNQKIFTTTILDNILFYRKVDKNTLEKVLKICRIDKLLKNKPLGLLTNLEEGDFSISGGEKQRIILARSLLKESEILIFDEALSQVEDKLETSIIKDILKYYSNKTIIYVSHRRKDKLFDRVIDLEKELERETT